MKNGKYAAVITPSKDAVSSECKWIKIREGQSPDYDMLAKLLTQASGPL
ncbi:hypothetical protein [Paenibacillus piri]